MESYVNLRLDKVTVRSKGLVSTTGWPPSPVSLEVRGRIRTPTRTWDVGVVVVAVMVVVDPWTLPLPTSVESRRLLYY